MHADRKFFSRIARYDVRAGNNPRENRLTEITAATLERVDGLAPYFADCLSGGSCPRWVAHGDAQLTSISTQVPVRGEHRSGFADLMIEFIAESPRRSYTLIVEVKHGAAESGDQVDVYSHHLSGRVTTESGLVILAPRSFVENARTGGDPAPRVAYWEDLSTNLRRYLQSHPNLTNAWLLLEYLNYLKEEGLMEPDRIDVQTALFMQLYPDAIKSVFRLDELVVEGIESLWGPSDSGTSHSTKRGPGRYNNFPYKSESGVPGWLELTLRDDRDLELSRGSLVYLAGPSWPKSAAQPSEEWFGELAQYGFQNFVLDSVPRCMRALYPEDLIAYPTLNEQANAVAAWTAETFQLASAAPA